LGQPKGEGNRWKARPALAGALVVVVFAVPVLGSIAVAWLVGQAWPPAGTTPAIAARWLVILGISTLVFVGCERVTRKVLPLTVLLKLGMIFPGRAPRRLSVARRSWTTRDLSRRIDDARSQGISDEPTVAAEQIVTLATTLSAHDRKTRGHAERVRAYTDLIAEELRLPPEDRDRLRWSALLHDVGKLSVHSDILNKPGKLSDEEWELMRRHPLEGARLTAPLAAWLGPWANTIAEHHERYDGQGYPHGLERQQISLGGRIVAVADCYDTMTSLRSYQKPKSTEAARAELAAFAGTQFDPTVVRAFLAVSVRRIHGVAPLAWIGTLPFGNLAPQLARLAAAGGRVAAGGAAATLAVVGLTAAQRAGTAAHPTQLSASAHGVTRSGDGGGSGDAGPTGSASTVHTGAGPHASGAVAGSRHNRSSAHMTGSSGSGGGGAGGSGGATGGGSEANGSNGASAAGGGSGTTTGSTGSSGGGSGSGSGSGSAPGTTTVPPGSGSPTTTTTVGSPPPGPTTTTTVAVISGPTNVQATGGCQVLVLGPEITVTWTLSQTSSVTEYRILRANTQTSPYEAIGTVGSTTTSYADQGASGPYWYEVVALAGSASSRPSGPVEGSVQGLCL
jgi:hypothetical protein